MIRSKLEKSIDTARAFFIFLLIIIGLFILALLMMFIYDAPLEVAIVIILIIALALAGATISLVKFLSLRYKKKIAIKIVDEGILEIKDLVQSIYHFNNSYPQEHLAIKISKFSHLIAIMLKRKYIVGFRLKDDKLIPTHKNSSTYYDDFDDPVRRRTHAQEIKDSGPLDILNIPSYFKAGTPPPPHQAKKDKKATQPVSADINKEKVVDDEKLQNVN
jgi:heme/copper-type cytochrome/quinol oxidase subunit 4